MLKKNRDTEQSRGRRARVKIWVRAVRLPHDRIHRLGQTKLENLSSETQTRAKGVDFTHSILNDDVRQVSTLRKRMCSMCRNLLLNIHSTAKHPGNLTNALKNKHQLRTKKKKNKQTEEFPVFLFLQGLQRLSIFWAINVQDKTLQASSCCQLC